MRKLRTLSAPLLALALVAAACGDDDDDDGGAAADVTTTTAAAAGGATTTTEAASGTDTSTATTEAEEETGPACDATVPGTQVNYGPYAPGASLDPPNSSGALVGGTELAAIYDVLMRFDTESGEFVPQLAESMEPNDDFTVWTLTLRDGIEYDDGSVLDAEMVLANIDRYFPEQGRVLNTAPPFLALIESSEVVDPLTIEFTLTQPWADFPFVFNDEPGMVVNVNAIGSDPAAFGIQPPPEAGVGPYVVDHNTAGNELVLKARDNYWGGPVCIETLRFNLAASSAIVGNETTYDAFKNGDLNVAFLRNSTVIAQTIEDGVQTSYANQDAGAVLIFNLREGRPLADPVLREGVAKSIDLDIINDRAYGGDLDIGKSLIVADSTYHTDDVVEMETDTAGGAQLIQQSGFSGTIEVLCANGPEATETSIATEAMLESQGLDVNVTNLPTTEQIGRLVTGDYDIGCWGLNAGPDTVKTAFVRNLLSTSPNNRQGLVDPAMDEALNALLAATTDELPAALAEVNNIYVENYYGVPIGALSEGVVIADDITGVRQTGSTIFLFDKAAIVS
jgi:peptide/nickel transport system substrate-binding protein